MSKVYVCLLAGLLGLSVSAQQLSPGTNAAPAGMTNANPVTPGSGEGVPIPIGPQEVV